MVRVFYFSILIISCIESTAQQFKAIAFFTKRNDQAHISFVSEANKWFYKMSKQNNFVYDSTNNWNNLNTEFLKKYQVVIFLDTRPDSLPQRKAFEEYIKNGGAWLGFHFAGFALNRSDFPQDWDWYHNEFIGTGQYVSNTWRPVPAVLKTENNDHPILKNIPSTFRSSASEWYRWEKDLTKNPNIKILLSVDPSSFPLGTGPKQHEIWHSGYYPIGWINTKYKMVYFNFGHNDIDYEGRTNKSLSYTFGNDVQDRLVLNSLMWLGSTSK